MIYCVCSLEPAEGEARIEALLAGGTPCGGCRSAPTRFPLLGQAVTPSGDLRTLPCYLAERGGLDGFFVARLEKHA